MAILELLNWSDIRLQNLQTNQNSLNVLDTSQHFLIIFVSLLSQFLTKQTAALKEVNESRVRVYEQLEESLEELEQDHTKLSEQSREERGRIQTLSSTVTVLETRWPATAIYLISINTAPCPGVTSCRSTCRRPRPSSGTARRSGGQSSWPRPRPRRRSRGRHRQR